MLQFHLLCYTQSSVSGTQDIGKIFILWRCAQCQAFPLLPYLETTEKKGHKDWLEKVLKYGKGPGTVL